MNELVNLPPYEQLFLLMLNPETGKLPNRYQLPRSALGLALLSSMALDGRFSLGSGWIPALEMKKPVNDTPPAVEAHWLSKIYGTRLKRTVHAWLQAMYADPKLTSMIAQSLSQKRLIGMDEVQIWLFTKRRYRHHQPKHQRHLHSHLQSVVKQAGVNAHEKDLLLIRILSSNRLLKSLWGADFFRQYHQAIKTINSTQPDQNPVYDYLHHLGSNHKTKHHRHRKTSSAGPPPSDQ